MNKKLKTKLDLVRLEGLCKLILSKFEEKEVINKIANITKTDPRDSKAIYKLSRSQLIKIIENSNISDEEIEKCYEEYRYGLKPGFSIYSFKTKVKISSDVVANKIKEELAKIQCLEDDQPPVKDIKFNNKDDFDTDLCEYSFYYSKKYTYIDEKDEPNYIYELKETFVWISAKYNFVAIKNCDERVVKRLSNIIANVYDTELISIVLTKQLIKKIFGDKRKKVAGVNPAAGENEAEKISISDSNLDKKIELNKQLEAYTMTSENLEIQISDRLNTLGVNNIKGKLHLTKNMTATVFRNWSIETIKKIIDYLSINETDFEIFKSKNIIGNTIWNDYNSEAKKLIEEIIFKVFVYFKDKEHYNPIINSKINYSKVVNKYFYSKLYVNCTNCGDNYCIPKCECGGYDIRINKNNNLFCAACGEKLISVQCEEGHLVNTENLDNVNIFLIPEKELYNKIIEFLDKEFNIKFIGQILISERNIQINEESIGTLIKPKDIKEFAEICNLKIKDDEKLNLQNRLKGIKEKCKESTKENCNNCNKSSDKCCILQLFTTYEGYRPGPHQGHEFGDVDFKVNYDGKEHQFVGIAKSYCNLTLGSSEGRAMIQQILTATRDKRVEIIGAICPTKFDTQLEKELEYLAKCTQSKIVILDDTFMIKQLKNYKNKKSEN